MISSSPDELLVDVASYLVTEDLGSLVRTSWRHYATLLPMLHQSPIPVFWAAHKGSISLLNRCQQYGSPIDDRWPDDSTLRWKSRLQPDNRPLHTAIQHLQAGPVEWLLAHGADPNEPFNSTEDHGCTSPLQLVLSWGRPPNSFSQDAQIRHWSKTSKKDWESSGRKYRILRALLKAGADPNDKLRFSRGPLGRAWTSGAIPGIPMMELLLEYGADPDQLCRCNRCFGKDRAAVNRHLDDWSVHSLFPGLLRVEDAPVRAYLILDSILKRDGLCSYVKMTVDYASVDVLEQHVRTLKNK